ncbi:hypothetical protein Dsin_006246 [Dipteronia sinensis]|uniref:Uncharacterized protein n=1 Tax=Dipteronia sinensis TaxID=43782 RepID=A0AAE0AZF1_9ROSI|nr:hypothetical protein Dsin_006246 [Dipteronia sinensis]
MVVYINSPLLFLPCIMSNSEVGVEFDILKRTQMPEFQGDHRRVITTTTTTTTAAARDQSSPEIGEDNKVHVKRLIGLGEFNATTSDHDGDEEGDQGFRTPTSSDHKIPKIKQCPPAPKKPMPPPPSKKRKSSSLLSSSPSTNARRKCLRSDLSPQDIDSLFPRAILNDLHSKIKKARTVLVKKEEEEDDNGNQ